MGGSGGGYIPSNWTAEGMEKQVRKSEQEAIEAGFKTTLSELMASLLSQINNRDVDLVQDRINELKEFFADDLDVSIDSVFGGSVAKHTYVDGLSDIDTLFVMKEGTIDANSPEAMVKAFEQLARTKLGASVQVTSGTLAVTLSYSDGMELQVLPAVRGEDGKLKIPSARSASWAGIAPQKFQEALTKFNQQNEGKLIPIIKLAKAVLANLPKEQRLSGYHVESLALEAFKGSKGEKAKHEMLVDFFGAAKKLVGNPIKDSTGQSRHVDDYLGDANSPDRQKMSYILERIEKRMRLANAISSKSKWNSVFGIEE